MGVAVREFTGSGELLGVYVLRGADDLELAFLDEFEQIQAEQFIGFADDGPRGGLTWRDVLEQLVEKQNMITVLREGPFSTTRSAVELLNASQEAIQEGLPIDQLPR